MISGFIGNVSTWLIKHNAIKPEDKELYEYAETTNAGISGDS